MNIERLTFDCCWVTVIFPDGEKGYINVSLLADRPPHDVFAMMYSLHPERGVEEIEYYENFSSFGAQERIEQRIKELYSSVNIVAITCSYFVIIEENGNPERFTMTFTSSSGKWELKSRDNDARKSSLTKFHSQNLRDTLDELYNRIDQKLM